MIAFNFNTRVSFTTVLNSGRFLYIATTSDRKFPPYALLIQYLVDGSCSVGRANLDECRNCSGTIDWIITTGMGACCPTFHDCDRVKIKTHENT